MPISLRRGASLATAATLLAGLVLNVICGADTEALTRPVGASSPSSASTAGATDPSPAGGEAVTTNPMPTPVPTPTPLPEPAATSLSRTNGGTAERATVRMSGRAMANVARVVIGGRDAQQLTLLSPTELRFVVPEADGFVPGRMAISLVSATDGARISTRFRWTYAVRSAVDREMAYAATHWDLRRSTRFGYLPNNDCVNFTSQLLLARGWHESPDWWNDGPVSRTVTSRKTVMVPTKVTVIVPTKRTGAPTTTVKGEPGTSADGKSGPKKSGKPVPKRVGKSAPKKVVKTVPKKVVKTVKKVVTTVRASAAWVSSTAMSEWLASRPDLATRLTYRRRAEVRIGDIVQFNWRGVGSSWDHTAVVSKIVIGPNGVPDIWYAEHTNHQLYGGSIGALAESPRYKHMRMQFWRIKR